MYYEINVSKNGKHYFATAERSLTSQSEAKEVYEHFQKLFPESEGYKLSCTRYEKHGYPTKF